MAVPRIETKDFLERFVRPIDESAAPVIEPETKQDVCVLERLQARALQQRLVDIDGPSDLTLFPIQVAEDEVDLQRVLIQPRRARQLGDRPVDLVGNEKMEA